MLKQILIGTAIWAILIFTVYSIVGWNKIKECYNKYFTREYWTDYNIVELASWLAKAIIIVPGLVFGIQVWWFYIFACLTSLTLIWASNKKLLPTLVAFNTVWVWLAVMSIVIYWVK